MNEQFYPTCTYVPADTNNLNNTEWTIEPSKQVTTQTPWCDIKQSKLFPHCQPITVDVHAGETLYLPSLWYHSVLQIDEQLQGFSGTIAVNWWYDMDYEPFSCFVSLVKDLGRFISGIGVDNVSDDDIEE